MTSAVEPKSSRSAEAGHWGKDVRSDMHVAFELRDSGGVEISLESRVAPYYGNAIVEQARQVLDELDIRHARLAIHDEGALPFVIAARIEAAVRRAGLALGKRSLPAQHPLPAPSQKDRLRRSRLYLPGSEPKYYINAALHSPDAVILDLEDSVHRDEKDVARLLVRNTLRAVDFGSCERMVRINQLPLGLEDLAEIVGESPDLVLIPKVEDARQVAEVDRMIGEIKSRQGIIRSIWIMPILESALGIENAFAVATSSENVAALTIGLEDYTADLGVAKTPEGRESAYARSRVVNAARARPAFRQLIRSSPMWRTWKRCAAGEKLRVPWASKVWAASIPGKSAWSTKPLRRRRQRLTKRRRSLPRLTKLSRKGWQSSASGRR